MGGSSTIYDVKVRYTMDGNAKRGMDSLAASTDKAHKSGMSLRGVLATIGGVGLLAAGKKALVDYNSEIQKMKIGLTTVINMQLKKPWDEAKRSADKLFERFQDMAKKSPATTKDFMEMGADLAPTIASMGGGTDKIASLTQGAILASQALGERADVVALDVKQMLAGTVGLKDRVANQLLSAEGMNKEDFNAMDAAKRAGLVEKMLTGPSLQNAANEFAESFAGQSSTFRDQLEITLGQVGKPLMESLTAEVKKWNTWIDKHPKQIARIANEMGSMIKGAFSFVRDVVTWLVDHRDTIMTIGKVFLVFKGAQLASNTIRGVADGISSFAGALKKGTNTMGEAMYGNAGMITGLMKFGGALLAATPYIAALGMAAFEAGNKLWDWATGKSKRDAQDAASTKDVRSLDEALGDSSKTIARLRQLDQLTENASATDPMAMVWQRERDSLIEKLNDPQFAGEILRNVDDAIAERYPDARREYKDRGPLDFMQRGFNPQNPLLAQSWEMHGGDIKLLEEVKNTLQGLQDYVRLSAREGIYAAAFPDQMPGQQEEQKANSYMSGWNPNPTKKDFNITIQRMEVASEDPDRFVHGLTQLAEDAVKNKTQASTTNAGGF
jgi:hypothetical protein